MEAGVRMGRVLASERRIFGPALVGGERAPWREAAGERRPSEVGWKARDRVERLCLVLVGLGNRGQQRLGIGVAHVAEQRQGAGALDLASGVHHDHAVGPAGDHSHVVRDQDDPHPELALELVEQAEDLGLDRDVERGRGLVRDQQLRLAGERHRDHDALAKSPRQLMGVIAHAFARPGHADHVERLGRARHRRRLGDVAMDADRLGDLATDGHRRVERGHRVLEDHADVVAADLADLLLADRNEVAAVQSDLAAGDEPAPRQQAHDRHRGHRLAAAGLADDAHGLSGLDVEAEAVDGVDGAAAQANPGFEIVDLQQSRHRRHRSCKRTSNASWSASPMKLKATTVITMIASAGYTSHQ